MINAKSLKIEKKTVTIKLSIAGATDEQKVKALYALLGGYNEVARNVDVDYYHAKKEKIEAAVDDIAYAMAISGKD